MPETQSDIHDRFSWRNVRTQQHAEPVPGAAVEQPVTVTLEEAFYGTERWLSVPTPNRQQSVVKLAIPPGVDNGTRIRFAGYGAPGLLGGSPGDLYLVISVTPHHRFTRQGAHLYHRVSVPRSQLTLGGVVHIRTLENKTLSLTIPARTTDGQRFRSVGRGMRLLGNPDQRGNLYVIVNDQLSHRAAPARAPNNPASAPNKTEREDPLIEHVFLAAILLLGIGVGFILYWLILD